MNKHHIEMQDVALLQAIGIDIYEPTQTMQTHEFLWLDEVLALLNVSQPGAEFNLKFDRQSSADSLKLDVTTATLSLPSQTFLSEIEFKKQVWATISTFVSAS